MMVTKIGGGGEKRSCRLRQAPPLGLAKKKARLRRPFSVYVTVTLGSMLPSFHPETVLFRPGGVNLRSCLCGVPVYASAQSLDFLARTKNPSFPNRKQAVSHPEFPDGNYITGLWDEACQLMRILFFRMRISKAMAILLMSFCRSKSRPSRSVRRPST